MNFFVELLWALGVGVFQGLGISILGVCFIVGVMAIAGWIFRRFL